MAQEKQGKRLPSSWPRAKSVYDDAQAYHSDLSQAPVYVNARELTSIHALAAYVAHRQSALPETVQAIVETRFGIENLEKLRSTDYMHAVEYLIDLKLEDVLN
ncbi:MAG: hypothetical protein FWF24_01350 [Alphaproteobacteria bacterium]|nr:hypothetical protein [Alphaproteobacteria bacterium]